MVCEEAVSLTLHLLLGGIDVLALRTALHTFPRPPAQPSYLTLAIPYPGTVLPYCCGTGTTLYIIGAHINKQPFAASLYTTLNETADNGCHQRDIASPSHHHY